MEKNELEFESALKDILGNHEVPYDETLWDSIQNELDKKPKSSSRYFGFAASAAGVIAIGAIAFMNIDNHQTPQTTKSINEKIIVSANNNPNLEAKSLKIVTDTFEDIEAKNKSKKEDVLSAISEDINEVNTRSIENVEPINYIDITNGITPPKEIEQKEPQIQMPTGNVIIVKKDLSVFSASSNQVCSFNSIQFYPENMNDEVEYLWFFGDGHSSNESMPVHKYELSGDYDISLEVRSSSTGELLANTKKTSFIEVTEAPIAKFDWSQNNEIATDPAITFTARAPNHSILSWNFGDGTFSGDKEIRHIFRNKGSYSVTLEVTSENDCKSKSSEIITISEDWNMLAPNAFSPDGDNINDLWFPTALLSGGTYSKYPFQLKVIHKNTGKTVFQSNSNSKQWNGQFDNQAQQAKAGDTFGWFAVVKTEFGQEEYSGSITVVD